MKILFLSLAFFAFTSTSYGQVNVRSTICKFENYKESRQQIMYSLDSIFNNDNSIRVAWDSNYLDSIVVVKSSFSKYILYLPESPTKLSADFCQDLLSVSEKYAGVNTYQYKLFSGDVLAYINNRIYRKLGERNFAKDSICSNFISLGQRCNSLFLEKCFRYIGNSVRFDFYSKFLTDDIVKGLKYSVVNNRLTDGELDIYMGSVSEQELLYNLKDTLNCNSFSYSKACTNIEFLKEYSSKHKMKLEYLADSLNTKTKMEERARRWKDLDLRKEIFRSLVWFPIIELAPEVEKFGEEYSNVDSFFDFDWRYYLALVNYKDYRTHYVVYVDTLINQYNKTDDVLVRINKIRTLFYKLNKLGCFQCVEKVFPYLLVDVNYYDGIFEHNFGYDIFDLLRNKIPELNNYGRNLFLMHCKKEYLQKKSMSARVSKVTNEKKGCVNCEYMYGCDPNSIKEYYPLNFNENMYYWLVNNKYTLKPVSEIEMY